MRGIEVDAARFRQIRRARGLTQPQLATVAGVGERTVRNAEAGRRVRLDFLKYLAIALGVDVVDVIHDRDELRTALLEQKRVEHILIAIEAFVNQRDMSEFISLVATNVTFNIPGPPEIPYAGEFRGADGLRTLVDINRDVFAYERPTEVSDTRSSGNLVVMSGRDWFRAVPTGKSGSSLWRHIYEFDRGRIVRVDDWVETAVVARAFQSG